MDPVLNHHTSQERQPAAMPELPNNKPHQKSGKAAGVDGILAEMLKAAEHEIIPFLSRYFNVLFSSAQFPLEWSKAVIIPLHKKEM